MLISIVDALITFPPTGYKDPPPHPHPPRHDFLLPCLGCLEDQTYSQQSNKQSSWAGHPCVVKVLPCFLIRHVTLHRNDP
jgi:hypothetical protein